MISVQRIVNVRQSIIFDWKCKVMRPNTKVVATGLFLVVEAPQEPGASESMFDFLSPHLVFFYPPLIHSFIHSFIHYGDLYSAPSRLLLRNAPDPCTAKKKSFETRVECVRKNPGEQSLRQRNPIPHRGTNHRECTGLGWGCTSKRNKE